MLLPVIDPRTRSSFRVAIVESIIDNLHFVVSLLEEPQVCSWNSLQFGRYRNTIQVILAPFICEHVCIPFYPSN
jgi:hypothetical protein